MATIEDVLHAFVLDLRPRFAGFTVNNEAVSVKVAEGWPNEETIQRVAKQKVAIIGVHDRFSGLDPKFPARRLGIEKLPIGIASRVSVANLANNATSQITLDYAEDQNAVLDKDAVSLVLNFNRTVNGAVATAVPGDTLTTLATKLKNEINTTLPDWVSATSSGAVVTITNNSGGMLKVESNTGNVGILHRELGRENAQIQIVVWAGEFEIRKEVSKIIQIAIGRLRAFRGIQLDNGERIRVMASNRFTMPNDKDTPADTYRRDFIVDCNYGLTTTDLVYSVLVPIARRFPL